MSISGDVSIEEIIDDESEECLYSEQLYYLQPVSNVINSIRSSIITAKESLVDVIDQSISCIVVNTALAGREHPALAECINSLGWQKRDVSFGLTGNIVWLGNSFDFYNRSASFLKLKNRGLSVVNRFPQLSQFAKKRWLAQVLRDHQRLYPLLYDFIPETLLLPEEKREAIFRLSQQSSTLLGSADNTLKRYYVAKPGAGCQGDGITLISSPEELADCGHLSAYILQQYISKPLLLPSNRRKFDLRIYVLLTHILPKIEAYIGLEGLVRFCTEEYHKPSPINRDNRFMHFTNYAVNKLNVAGFHRSRDIHDSRGSKRLLTDVLQEIQQDTSIPQQLIYSQITAIVEKTLIALCPLLVLSFLNVYPGEYYKQNSPCFQVLGFDILLDETGKCWLLEVNSNPSLRIDYDKNNNWRFEAPVESIIDRCIKLPLLRDALRIVKDKQLWMREAHSASRQSDLIYVSKMQKPLAVQKELRSNDDENGERYTVPQQQLKKLMKCSSRKRRHRCNPLPYSSWRPLFASDKAREFLLGSRRNCIAAVKEGLAGNTRCRCCIRPPCEDSDNDVSCGAVCDVSRIIQDLGGEIHCFDISRVLFEEVTSSQLSLSFDCWQVFLKESDILKVALADALLPTNRNWTFMLAECDAQDIPEKAQPQKKCNLGWRLMKSEDLEYLWIYAFLSQKWINYCLKRDSTIQSFPDSQHPQVHSQHNCSKLVACQYYASGTWGCLQSNLMKRPQPRWLAAEASRMLLDDKSRDSHNRRILGFWNFWKLMEQIYIIYRLGRICTSLSKTILCYYPDVTLLVDNFYLYQRSLDEGSKQAFEAGMRNFIVKIFLYKRFNASVAGS